MWQLNYTLSVGDLANLALLIIAVGGILLTLRQLSMTHRLQRATFFTDLYSKLVNNTELRDIFYQIDADKLVIDKSGKIEGIPEEKAIDNMLGYLNLVCHLYEMKFLTKEEMTFFEYPLRRVCRNTGIQSYLKYLEVDLKAYPYQSFVSYSKTVIR